MVLFAWVSRGSLASPIPQAVAYHQFADARTLWGLRNFGNVVSNAPFALVGLLALGTLAYWVRRPAPGVQTRFELVAFALFFVGVFLTAFGSGYYHLEPSNPRLFWDRLPMTIGFMSLLAITIGERIDRRAGAWLLAPLLLAGAASVVLWQRSEQAGHGDLRFYLLVQFAPLVTIPLMLWLFPAKYTRTGDLLVALGFYALAKVLEVADQRVYSAGHLVSGHTLKHLSAALATYWLFRMLRLRRPLAERTAGARRVRGTREATPFAAATLLLVTSALNPQTGRAETSPVTVNRLVTSAEPQTTKAVDPDVMTRFCSDEDGCEVVLSQITISSGTPLHARSLRLFGKPTLTGRWITTEGVTAINGDGPRQAVVVTSEGVSVCSFMDGDLESPDDTAEFFLWNVDELAAYECRLVLID
jgi:hypothetical protein